MDTKTRLETLHHYQNLERIARMNAATYKDSRGQLWLLVATTKAGIYAWFRPIAHADDGSYDKSLAVASLTQVQS